MKPDDVHESGRIISYPCIAVHADSRVRMLHVVRPWGPAFTVRLWRAGAQLGVYTRGKEGWFL